MLVHSSSQRIFVLQELALLAFFLTRSLKQLPSGTGVLNQGHYHMSQERAQLLLFQLEAQEIAIRCTSSELVTQE